MSKLLRTTEGKILTFVGLFVGAVFLAFFIQRQALAAPYVNPFWTNTSPSQESAITEVAHLGLASEGEKCWTTCLDVAVDVRTGELFWDHLLFRTPGILEDNVFALRWRSMISGSSQLGNGILPSWETTANYVLLIPGSPNAPNGHRVDIRRPTGRVDAFIWNGTAYVAPADVFDALTTNGGGNYVLTDKWGGSLTFDALGMPNLDVDTNGNTDTLTYNTSYQITGYTDDRGQTYAIASNANGYIATITDPAGRTWTFTYDAFDNLKYIKTPTTADQPAGITTTLNYDGLNRLVSVTDGRGNTVWQFAYVGTTGQISGVTINGSSVTYSYAAGVTTRTDRNGNVFRSYFSGAQITKTDMFVNSQAKYVTLYRYSGVFPANTVFPRGNRIDTVYDSVGNLTGRRHRTQDTSTNDASDIVHAWVFNASNFKTSYTDPLGNQWTYGRDGAGNLTSETHPTVTSPASQTASRSLTYNASGQITQVTDEEGTNTAYSYFTTGSSVGLLQKIEVDPTGLDLETLFTYDSAGNVATRTDPNGNQWSNTWDNVRRLTQTQAPSALGYEIKYLYDANGNLDQRDVENVDKDGNQVTANPWFTTTVTYTNTDDVATIVEEIDASTTRTTSLEYDNNQNLIRVTKPEGNKERWDFNERDWIVAHVRGETDTDASTESRAYDENGNLVTVTDGRGNYSTSTYDLFDRRTRETNALGHYTEWTFDKNGNVTEIARKDSTDTTLQRETYYHDQRNRRWKTEALFKDPSTTYSDAVTVYERLKTGQIKKITDPRSKVTTHDFDAAHRKTKTTDAMGNELSLTLDGNGNPTAWSIKEIDGAGSVTHEYEATYDELDRRKTYVEIDRTDSQNRLTMQTFHDSRSNLVFLINAEGNPTRWTFDGLNRMTRRERALAFSPTIDDFTSAQVTEWGFDKNNRMTSHKDDGTNVSTWGHDALDRVATLTYPDTSSVAYEYDENDNITKTTDPSGNEIDDTFDDLNRNTSRSVTLVTGFLDTTTETRSFDALNRITMNRDDDYQLNYTYAVIGLNSLVYEETQAYYGAQNAYSKTVTKTYDGAGNRATEAYPSGANLSLVYSYNDVNMLTGIGDGTNTLASYSHVGLRKKDTTYQSGAVRKNFYTGFRDELESVRHETSGQSTILRLDYAYNKVHDRLYERFGGSGSSGDAFAYDKIQRLTTAWMGSSAPEAPASNPYVKKIDYNMDDDGNRTSVALTLYQQTPTSTGYTTNNLYEYSAVGGTTHVWDANGNLKDNGTYKFKYSYKNLIAEVRLKSDDSLVATYKHDAEGRRVEKELGGGVERYIRSEFRGETISHVVAVYGGSDNWLQNFVWNDEPDGIEVLEQKDVLDYDTDGNTAEITRSYYHRNALGSVMEITDANENVVVSYRYDPYGKITITVGGTPQTSDPLGQHWTFTGRFLDEESGLYHYRARYYDPALGRFLQRDPLGYSTNPNLYCYASSSPSQRADPSGLWDKHSIAVRRRIREASQEHANEPDSFTPVGSGIDPGIGDDIRDEVASDRSAYNLCRLFALLKAENSYLNHPAQARAEQAQAAALEAMRAADGSFSALVEGSATAIELAGLNEVLFGAAAEVAGPLIGWGTTIVQTVLDNAALNAQIRSVNASAALLAARAGITSEFAYELEECKKLKGGGSFGGGGGGRPPPIPMREGSAWCFDALGPSPGYPGHDPDLWWRPVPRPGGGR